MGFSIREYASRMRIVKVAKCWPFDDSIREGTVRSFLPPITVKKFTWWIDELEYMHLECGKNVIGSEKKRRKKVLEKGETSLVKEAQTVLDPGIDGEEGTNAIKVKSLRGKGKAPKERSIVEIFAVAAPIERVWSEESEEKEGSIQEEGSFNFKHCHEETMKSKKKKKTEGTLLCKAKRVVKKIKKKKAKKTAWSEIDLSFPNMENCLETELRGPDDVVVNQSSSVDDEFENDARDCVSILNRKPRLQHLDKALWLVEEENQHSRLPLHGILKNNVKSVSQQQSRRTIVRPSVRENHRSARMENRCVGFSDNDDTLGRIPSHTIQCCNLLEVCNLGMGNGEPTGVVGKDSTAVETIVFNDASTWMEEDVGDAGASVKHLNRRIINPTAFTMQNNEDKLFGRRVASERLTLQCMDQHLSDSVGIGDTPQNCACPPGFIFMPMQGSYSRQNIKWMQNSSNCINNDFVGLPLNSQGELLLLHSSSKRDFKQTMTSSTSAAQSIRLSSASIDVLECSGNHLECQNFGCSTSTLGMLNLFPANNHVKENAVVVPSTVGDTNKSHSDWKRNHYLDLLTLNGYSSDDSLDTKCIDDNQVQKSHGKQKISSTMRLMGQEFTVSGKGFEGFENGHIWKNKLISEKLNFGNNSIRNKIVLSQDKPFLGKLGKTMFCPTEFTVNQVPQSMPMFSHFDSQSISMYGNDFVSKEVIPIPQSYTSCSPGAFSEVSNRGLLLPKSLASGSESQLSIHALTTPATAHEEPCPDGSRSPLPFI